MIPCRYFDGTSSRRWTASVEAQGTALHIVGDGIDRVVDHAALSFAPACSGAPARIAFTDGGLCEIDDPDASAALFAALGHRRSVADTLVARTWQVVAVTVAFVVVMGALYRWGVPWLSDRIVDRAPRSWDQALGGQVLQTLDARGILKPTALPQARRDAIGARLRSLHLPPDAPAVRLVFRKLGVPNAFALPDGVIVITDEIVALTDGDDDALATILAHEVGHVAHRDAMRQLARGTITSAIAAWYLGDFSNAAAVTAGGIGTMRYSREAEHQADLYAVDVMHASGRSTRGAADLFRRLEAWEPPKAGKANDAGDAATKRERLRFPEYLSTHPDTDDRIRLFENDGGVAPAH